MRAREIGRNTQRFRFEILHLLLVLAVANCKKYNNLTYLYIYFEVLFCTSNENIDLIYKVVFFSRFLHFFFSHFSNKYFSPLNTMYNGSGDP